MPKSQPITFLDYLLKREFILKEQAQRIGEEMERTGRNAEDIILEGELLAEADILRAKSDFLGIPYRFLQDVEISPSVLKEIPEDAARIYQLVPLARDGQSLEVGVLNPEDVRADEALRFLAARAGVAVKKFLISRQDYAKVLRQYRIGGGEVGVALEELQKELATPLAKGRKRGTKGAPETLEEEAPITKIVAVMVRNAVEGRASDIHIEPDRKTLRIRYRVDGTLHASLFLPLSIHPAIVSKIKILADMKIDETRLPQDGRFHMTIEEREIDFRVATLPTAHGEKVAIRLLDPAIGIKTLAELGLVGRNLQVVMEAVERPFGMVLLTGPTGSGKSTTLYGVLKIKNKESENIVSLEDPVEYFIDGVNQAQIHEEIGFTFATGLRHVLRGDPNIIMVGEIRDTDTAKLAVHAGLTGHLVFSTLHTNNAIGVIPRLTDMGIERFLIPSTLVLAMAQRLLPRLCIDCKRPEEASPAAQALIREQLMRLPADEQKKLAFKEPYTVFRASGCDRCGHAGKRGRVAMFEALTMTRELESVILHELSEVNIVKEAQRQGMITMLQDGILKVLEGTVALEDVLQVAEEQA